MFGLAALFTDVSVLATSIEFLASSIVKFVADLQLSISFSRLGFFSSQLLGTSFDSIWEDNGRV